MERSQREPTGRFPELNVATDRMMADLERLLGDASAVEADARAMRGALQGMPGTSACANCQRYLRKLREMVGQTVETEDKIAKMKEGLESARALCEAMAAEKAAWLDEKQVLTRQVAAMRAAVAREEGGRT